MYVARAELDLTGDAKASDDRAPSDPEFERRLAGGSPEERDRLLATLLREARDTDVWRFVAPAEVASALPRIAHRLGRRRPFWEFLIGGWRDDGLLAP